METAFVYSEWRTEKRRGHVHRLGGPDDPLVGCGARLRIYGDGSQKLEIRGLTQKRPVSLVFSPEMTRRIIEAIQNPMDQAALRAERVKRRHAETNNE